MFIKGKETTIKAPLEAHSCTIAGTKIFGFIFQLERKAEGGEENFELISHQEYILIDFVNLIFREMKGSTNSLKQLPALWSSPAFVSEGLFFFF